MNIEGTYTQALFYSIIEGTFLVEARAEFQKQKMRE